MDAATYDAQRTPKKKKKIEDFVHFFPITPPLHQCISGMETSSEMLHLRWISGSERRQRSTDYSMRAAEGKKKLYKNII